MLRDDTKSPHVTQFVGIPQSKFEKTPTKIDLVDLWVDGDDDVDCMILVCECAICAN